MYNKTNIQKIFSNLFFMQLLLNITSYFCDIANGYIAGNFVDSIAVSCNSLISPYNLTISSVAYIFSSSCEIICGKFLGVGDRKSLNKTLSTVTMLAIFVAIGFTLASFIAPTFIVRLLGANAEIIEEATNYLYGYSIGIFAHALMPVFITFLNIENEGKYVTKSVILLAVLYMVFGYTFTKIINLSYFGLGLTNSLSQIFTLLFLSLRLIKNKNQIFFVKFEKDLPFIKKIFILGLPSGYTGFLQSIRDIIMNYVLISTGGLAAVAAHSVNTSSVAIQNAIVISALNTSMIITSICVGEKNKDELKQLIKHVFINVLPFCLVCVVAQVALSPFITGLFTNDPEVLKLVSIEHKMYLFATIFEVVNDCLIAMFTVFERFKFVHFFNVMHCFVLHVLFDLVLKEYIGLYAVYGSFLFTEIISFILYIVYSSIANKALPTSYYDLVVIKDDDFNVNKLSINIASKQQVSNISEKISVFCIENNVDKRKANIAGLCTEEMAANIFEHGFTKKAVLHQKIDIFVVVENNEIVIRIRDNAISFNPETRSIIFNPEDPCKNVGLRIVKNISKELTYQNLFGLNNTIIKI